MSTHSTSISPTSPDNHNGMAAKDPVRRRNTLLIVSTLFVVIALIWFALWFFVFSTRESTDNAYVEGNQVILSSRVPGTVVSILTHDTAYVKAGQVLVRLDSTDADIRLAQARGHLAMAVRRVREQIDSAASADAVFTMRKVQLKQARADLKRHQPLLAAHAESLEIVQHLRDSVAQTRYALIAAKAQARAAHAAISGTDIANNPAVEQAKASFRAAWLASKRNTIVTPVSGMVVKRSVQLGSNVIPGQPLMEVVPLHQLWVNANFKETQLRRIHVGQTAKITTDLYGSEVIYHGRVEGIGAGTGSALSLLPAQNATGNWIKVVQRLPVRISFNAKELDKHPLRIGLSTHVIIHFRNDNRPPMVPVDTHPATTDVYDHLAAQAEAAADRIIRTHLISSSYIAPNH